jgi:hypothetical protein
MGHSSSPFPLLLSLGIGQRTWPFDFLARHNSRQDLLHWTAVHLSLAAMALYLTTSDYSGDAPFIDYPCWFLYEVELLHHWETFFSHFSPLPLKWPSL